MTLEAKKRGVTTRHNDLKHYIHSCSVLKDELEFGAYEKTLVDVGNGNQAFLYHPCNYDTNQYVPLTPPSNNQPINQQPSNSSIDFDDVDGYNLDQRNRLLVPTKFFKELEVNPGEKVFVVKSNSHTALYITREVVSLVAGDESDSLTVERNGDVRISRSALLKSGLKTGTFQIEKSSYQGKSAIAIFNKSS